MLKSSEELFKRQAKILNGKEEKHCATYRISVSHVRVSLKWWYPIKFG